LKQRLDSPFEKETETMNRLPKFQGEKLVKQLLDCRFEKEIKNMDRLAKIQGQKTC